MDDRLQESGEDPQSIEHPTSALATDLLPILRVYKDSRVERLQDFGYAPPSPEDPTTGVSSKDVTISPVLSARLYLPKLTNNLQKKLPILLYFHGGAFVVGSVANPFCQHYLNSIVSESNSLAVSVEYRLAPENPLPIAYEDSWNALQWVVSHSVGNKTEPWLTQFGDFDKLYLGGDSAGANIVHNLAMRAGEEGLSGGIKIIGGFLSFPYFLGSKPIGSEPVEDHEQGVLYRCWLVGYPSAAGGIDNPMMNPWAGDAPSLKGIGCSKILVIVGEKDYLRDRGVRYYAAVKESGWKGEVELQELEGEDHCFHLSKLETQKAKDFIKLLASFINS